MSPQLRTTGLMRQVLVTKLNKTRQRGSWLDWVKTRLNQVEEIASMQDAYNRQMEEFGRSSNGSKEALMSCKKSLEKKYIWQKCFS